MTSRGFRPLSMYFMPIFVLSAHQSTNRNTSAKPMKLLAMNTSTIIAMVRISFVRGSR